MFQDSLKEVSRLLQGSFKDVSRMFQRLLEDVSRAFHKCFKDILRVIFMVVPRTLLDCLKGVSRKFLRMFPVSQKSFMLLGTHRSCPSRRRACFNIRGFLVSLGN